MTTHAPMARVPFAPLDNPRLQHLASAKNRQNGHNARQSLQDGKTKATPLKTVSTSTKRAFEPCIFDEADGENVDPATLDSQSKKSKHASFDAPIKPFAFTLTSAKSMPPPPTIPSRLSTPARANMSSPRAPSTAPAGRSPKRKTAGRRISAPFTRIDPPFGTSRISTGLPFSLDSVLGGTSSSSAPAKKDAGATIQESMPKDWFFDVYEDTPEEEAATLMEHSTLTLDLSSDDESSRKEKDDRGKENVPPGDYDVPRRVSVEIVRKKVQGDAMDDGARSPLSDLEAELFGEDDATADAVEGEAAVTAVVKPEVKTKGDFVVWEDEGTDENAAPVI